MVSAAASAQPTNAAYARGLARAVGGALLFALPLLMTMEMWALGDGLPPERLLLFLLVGLPLIWGLNHFVGFRHTVSLIDDALDTLAALLVGAVTATLLLILFGVLGPGQPVTEMIGKIAIQTIPAGMGAVLASKQLSSGRSDDEDRAGDVYPAELFLMVAGALFVALNMAPTEEMRLIAYQMTPWHALVAALGSLALLHAMVYSLGFQGQHESPSFRQALLHFSLPGYALVLVTATYIQWTFGHLDGHGLGETIMTTVVIGVPGAIGAGAARLLV